MNYRLVQANDLYYKGISGDDGMGLTMRRSFMERAIGIYKSEFKKADRAGRRSLWKNLGMAHFRLAQMMELTEFDIIMQNLCDAVSAFTRAWLAQDVQMREGEWGSKVQETIADCFRTAFRSG